MFLVARDAGAVSVPRAWDTALTRDWYSENTFCIWS